MNAVYVAVGLAAMLAFLLSGAALLAQILQPAGFVTLSMVAAALLLGSIAKLETGCEHEAGRSRPGPSA